MEKVETIIIGGGISGLSCARELHGSSRDFLLISKELGGRITSSADGEVNYGAFYVRSDYTHVLPFVKRGRPFKPSRFSVKRSGETLGIWEIFFRHPILFLKLLAHIYRFNYGYQKFKKNSLKYSQFEAIKKDLYLKKLLEIDAMSFLKEAGLQPLASYFLDQTIRSTAFMDVEEKNVSALTMFACLLLFILPTYEFRLDIKKLISGLEGSILIDEVISTEYKDGLWSIKTAGGKTFCSEVLVAGMPIHITKELLSLDIETNQKISVFMAHVKGVLKVEYREVDECVALPIHSGGDIVITREPNGTELFYSHDPNYDLSKYYESHEVIAKHYWHPAGYIGKTMLPCEFENNLFVIGDNNVCGMEDAAITGIYAANKILEKFPQ